MSPPSFSLSLAPTEIARSTDHIVALLRSAGDAVISSVSSHQTPKASTLLSSFYRPQDTASALQHKVTFPSMVSSDAAVRSASVKAKKTLADAWAEPFARPDVYRALKSADASSLSPTDATLYKRTLALFERTGSALSDADRAKFLDLKAKISALELEFQTNINEDSTELWFSETDLAGAPADWIAGLPTDTSRPGLRKVSMKAPDVTSVLQFVNSPSTRRAVSAAYNSRCVSSNLPVLVRLLGARHDAARILGYDCWADYRLSACMARTSPAVIVFLMRVLDGVKKRRESDLEAVRELKAKTEGTALEETRVEVYDVPYYESKLRQALYGVDDDAVRAYFPTSRVVAGVLKIYEDVFRLKFTPVTDRSLVWNDEVQYYRVNERSESSDVEGELVGYFALDMHPRPGKYSHQCVVPLVPSLSGDVPVACNVGNLARPGKDGEGVMRHAEVRTFFHEFGHILHHVCTRSEHYLGSWTWSVNPYPGGVELDYLETPSQTLENFLWQPSILRLLSSHHTTSAPLPEPLITGLSRSRNIMSGYHYSRQIFLSLWDMEVHSRAWKWETEVDVKSGVEELKKSFEKGWRESTGMDVVEGTMMAASWYHPAMGYDAGYYSYLWAEVYAHDVFSIFASSPQSCLDADTGARYRSALLQPGATRDAEDMLREFLGREPNEEAFLREIMAE